MRQKLRWGALDRLRSQDYSWKKITYYGVGLGAIAALYLFKLQNLPGGYSENEATRSIASSSLKHIWENPIDAPHKLLSHAYSYGFNDLLATRLATATFAIIGAVFFFFVIRKWHNARVAFWATAIFAVTSAMLHHGRWGGEGTVLLSTLTLAFLLIGLWAKYKNTDFGVVGLLCFVILIGVSLYVPGMIWVVVLLAVLGGESLRNYAARYAPSMKALAFVLLIALIAPLGWYVSQAPIPGLLAVAGLTDHASSVVEGLKDLALLPVYIVYGGYTNPELWLGSVPILSVFGSAMAFLGTYFYISRAKRVSRTYIVLALVLLGGILASQSNYITLPLLTLGLCILIAGGLEELHRRWFAVFPRNTFAQNTGVVLLSLLVLVASFYNLRHYFVAWPSAPGTAQVYTVNKK